MAVQRQDRGLHDAGEIAECAGEDGARVLRFGVVGVVARLETLEPDEESADSFVESGLLARREYHRG